MEFDQAAKRSRQDDDVEECDHHPRPNQSVLPRKGQEQLDKVTIVLPLRPHKIAEDSDRLRTQVHNDSVASSLTEQNHH